MTVTTRQMKAFTRVYVGEAHASCKAQRTLPAIASQTPESVFAGKYDWLLRWAMHFAKNDRTAAEDLVQETFVRLMVSWSALQGTIEQTEAILYSYLKYACLTELRRARRLNFKELSVIEFDDLQLSLHEERGSDPIALQNNLRRIAAYLCWRKRSSKAARPVA